MPTVITPEGREACRFGALNLLQFKAQGRAPTADEWSELERRTQTLWDLLSEGSRGRFILGEIPKWISVVMLSSLGVALASLLTALLVLQRDGASALLIVPYMGWLMALGTIGSLSFIGMNALSVLNDATFDLSNAKLIILRISVGALFGVVISVALGYPQFQDFVKALVGSAGAADKELIFEQAMWLLLPFVLGFSTSLVIMILNRFAEAIQTFFGKGEAQRAKKE
jgi:hypothetical protein